MSLLSRSQQSLICKQVQRRCFNCYDVSAHAKFNAACIDFHMCELSTRDNTHVEILFRFLDMDLWQDTEPMLRVLCYKDFGSTLCFQTVPLAAMLTLDKASHLIISVLAGSLPQGGFPQYLSCQDRVVSWCCTDHPAEPGDMRGVYVRHELGKPKWRSEVSRWDTPCGPSFPKKW